MGQAQAVFLWVPERMEELSATGSGFPFITSRCRNGDATMFQRLFKKRFSIPCFQAGTECDAFTPISEIPGAGRQERKCGVFRNRARYRQKVSCLFYGLTTPRFSVGGFMEETGARRRSRHTLCLEGSRFYGSDAVDSMRNIRIWLSVES